MNDPTEIGIASLVLVLLVFLMSIVESSITRLSRLSLKVLAEKETDPRLALLGEIAKDRRHFLLPVQFGIQLLLIALTVLLFLIFASPSEALTPALLTLGAMFLVIVLFRQLLPRLITERNPERVLRKSIPFFSGVYRILNWCSFPIFAAVRAFSNNRNGETDNAADEETTEEEIQAYLGVGEEEGIFEQAESALIQSALLFGSTLVREIMTPRSEMVAIELNATIGELKDLMVSTKHSRIPVFREHIDQIQGIVYVRNLLGILTPDKETDSIAPLVNDALLVPETKKLAPLLKEMQENAEHMAIVINEFGAVAGLVTIEDVLEEIVGEIHDEDELRKVDIFYEGDRSYVVRGSVEIEDLEEVLNVHLEERDVTTFSGYLVDILGRVPVPGESISLEPFSVEILSSDRKRIHTMRVRLLDRTPDSQEEPKPLARREG